MYVRLNALFIHLLLGDSRRPKPLFRRGSCCLRNMLTYRLGSPFVACVLDCLIAGMLRPIVIICPSMGRRHAALSDLYLATSNVIERKEI